MLSVSLTGCRSPCASVGVHARLALRNSLQRRYHESISNIRANYYIPISHLRGTFTRDSSPGSTYESKYQSIHRSTPGLVGQPYSSLKFHVISHSPMPSWCSIRVSGAPRQLKPSGVATLPKAYSTDQSKPDAGSAGTQEPPPKELRTHLEAFFAEYPGFDYDPTKPCMDEFKRLTKWAGWEKKSEEFEKARKGMNEALTDQFNAIYGKDPDDIAAWRNLCSVLNLAEIPTEISACKRLIKSLYINIVDLIDQPVTDVRVGYFRTENELARYTWEHEKFYGLQAAKAGGLLKRLLRFIEQPRRKSRSRPKLRKA
ncbi:unnamed protein product [Rhizoctonia solani]|uniref:Uncharacterized protein n=1 Tax=Rhizoctonia solani TaxID=456999 RepID=A0A8H3B603_9AGAM|nr:unnamed protein product [Rhizoctonia solani]